MLRSLIQKTFTESSNRKEGHLENLNALSSRVSEDSEGESDGNCTKTLRSRFISRDHSESEVFPSFSNLSTNLLVAPKEITKLFLPKEERIDKTERSDFQFREKEKPKEEMEYYHNNDNTSSTSDIDLSQEESICNQELLMPKLRSRKLTEYQKGREYQKVNRDFSNENSKHAGDTLKEDLSDLAYPVTMGNIKLPKKRELHRLIHHRLCNYVNPDIMLVIDKHEFFCHRIVLQSYSTFFDNINNLQDDNVITIKEKGVTKEAFIAIYAWMLSLNDSRLEYITRENFVEVLMASQVLQIRDLEEQCLALLDSKDVFYEGYAYQLFQQASKLQQNGIKELMVPRIQHFFLPFVSTQEFVDLPLEDVCTFLSSSYIVVHSEMEVFMSAARWLLDDWAERKQHLPKVMNCVRFGLMNPLELVDIRKNPESPEFLKVTEDRTIQKYIDDGLAYSTYCTMKGGTEELKYRCELFGLEIPQPRNWADTTKCYKSYGEFLNFLKQFRTNPLRMIEGIANPPSQPCIQAPRPLSLDNSSFQLEFNPQLHTFSDGIPSMSDLLSASLRHKARKDKQKGIASKNTNDNSFQLRKIETRFLTEKGSKLKTKNNNPCQIIKIVKKEPSLKCKAATIIQAAYRGYKVRKKYNFTKKAKETKSLNAKNKYNKYVASDLTVGSSEENNHNNRLIKKSTSDINFHTNNNTAQACGSLYLPQIQSVLLLGGLNPQQELSLNNDGRGVFRYSLEINKWEKVSSLPRGRYYHNAAFLKGKVYVLGGVDPKMEDERQSCICSDMWSFNPSNGEWLKETSMKTPRKNFGLVAFQGYLYAIGGQGLNETILSSVEKYDPVKRSWESVSSLPEPRLSPAVARFGGSIWVVGGMGNTSKPTMSTHVYSFDPRHNAWVLKPPIRVGKAFSVLINWEDKLYLIGGAEKEKGCSVSSNTIDIFDPKLNKWEVLLQMRTARHSHTSTIIDNCLYIMGGTTTQQMKSLNDVEIWSLENKALKRHVPTLPTILTGHAMITLPSGSTNPQ